MDHRGRHADSDPAGLVRPLTPAPGGGGVIKGPGALVLLEVS